MTLLKAFCTSLKKINLLLILFLFLLMPLSGASFRVALVSHDEEYSNLVEEVLEVFSSSISSSYADEKVNERLFDSAQRDYYSTLDRYLKAENFTSLEKLEFSFDKEAVDSIEIVKPTLDGVEIDNLLNGNKDAYEYISARDGYDMLIGIASSNEELLPQITLYLDGEVIREALFHESLLKEEEKALFDIFSPLFLSSSYVLLSYSLPSGGTLYIDGEDVLSEASYLAVEQGVHEISYIIPGYISKKFNIVVEPTDEELDLLLQLLPPTSLHVATIPYDANVFYNGSLLEERTIKELVYPFTITAAHEDFSLYSMQSLTPVESLTITLKPAWMDSENILERSKSDFYTSLFATLMSFGAYVACQSINNLRPEYNIAPVTVVLGGISLVSLINMVDSMFEYFDSASYGI